MPAAIMSSSLFTAEMDDIKILYNILKAISFQEFAVIRPLEEGLKITVEDMTCCESSVYIAESVFTSYYAAPDQDINFKINLKILTESLHIYGEEGTPSLKFNYKGHGHPLSLLIKHSDENITVDCQLNTLAADDSHEINLADECNINNIVVKGEQFVDVLSDLDLLSDEFYLKIDTDPPVFQISATGILGHSVLDIPQTSDMVIRYQVKADFKAKYSFSTIRKIMKVMQYAKHVSISTGDTGLLGIQLNVISGERKIFVEYYVTAMFDEDDDYDN